MQSNYVEYFCCTSQRCVILNLPVKELCTVFSVAESGNWSESPSRCETFDDYIQDRFRVLKNCYSSDLCYALYDEETTHKSHRIERENFVLK